MKRKDPITTAIPLVEVEDITHSSLPHWYDEEALRQKIDATVVVENYHPVKMNSSMWESLKEYVRDVMPEPTPSYRIYQKLTRNELPITEIIQLINSDPLLAAQILKTANSSEYAFRTEVNSIGRAVTLLGYQTVTAITLSQSVKQCTIGDEDTQVVTEKIRSHSAMVSAVAQQVAMKTGTVDQFEAATLGLLHDIGKILHYELVKQGKVVKTTLELPKLTVEAIIASIFAELWELPTTIVQSLQAIPYPFFYPYKKVPTSIVSTVTVIAVANFLANISGFDDGDKLYIVHGDYLRDIDFPANPVHWLTPQIAVEIEKSRIGLS